MANSLAVENVELCGFKGGSHFVFNDFNTGIVADNFTAVLYSLALSNINSNT